MHIQRFCKDLILIHGFLFLRKTSDLTVHYKEFDFIFVFIVLLIFYVQQRH